MSTKIAPVVFGLIGAATFAVSALRPELVRDGLRYIRWQQRSS